MSEEISLGILLKMELFIASSIDDVSSFQSPANDENKVKSNETTYIYVVPFSVQSDIFGRSGAWRVWSCIWLAHLIQKGIESIPTMSGTLTPVWKQKKRNSTLNSKIDILNLFCKIKNLRKTRFNLDHYINSYEYC